MTIRYELWDGESGNLLWTYVSEADALGQIREFIRDGGPQTIDGLALVRVNRDGSGAVVAEDGELASRAQKKNPSIAAAS